jgi:mannose-6-phosphate isomerase
MEEFPEPLLGTLAGRFTRFPLLLKFLDAQQMLSVQVHPSDAHPDLLPAGETGKTEAWVVLKAAPESLVYAGLKPGTTAVALRRALSGGAPTDDLARFTPRPGDGVFLPAGTVHSLGGGVVVFEIQQNSDVTFRLYDWDHIDAKTGQPRALHVEQALSCIDFAEPPVSPVTPQVDAAIPGRQRLFHCEQFSLWRVRTSDPFTVGAVGVPRVLVCVDGAGHVEHGGAVSASGRGDVLLLPAVLGQCVFRPTGEVTVLEVGLPEGAASAGAPHGQNR